MTVKPQETTRIFTVQRKWKLSNEDLTAIICRHLGIPNDSNTTIELSDYSDSYVTRVDVNRQEE